MQEMQAAADKPIEEVTSAHLSPDASLFGAAGSPTWVADIQLIEPHRSGVVIEEPDPETAVRQVIDGLKENAPASTASRASARDCTSTSTLMVWEERDRANSITSFRPISRERRA